MCASQCEHVVSLIGLRSHKPRRRSYKRKIQKLPKQDERRQTMKRNLEHDALLQEASSILSKERLSREDTARAEQLMALADRVDPRAMELRRAKLAVEELSLGLRSEANAAAAEVEREFRQYLIHGRKELLSDKTRMEMSGAVAQSRSQALGSGSTGFIVPASFVNVLESSLIATDPI